MSFHENDRNVSISALCYGDTSVSFMVLPSYLSIKFLNILRLFVGSVHLSIPADNVLALVTPHHFQHLLHFNIITMDSLQKPVSQIHLSFLQGQPLFSMVPHIIRNYTISQNKLSWEKLVSYAKMRNWHNRKEEHDLHNFFLLNYHIQQLNRKKKPNKKNKNNNKNNKNHEPLILYLLLMTLKNAKCRFFTGHDEIQSHLTNSVSQSMRNNLTRDSVV